MGGVAGTQSATGVVSGNVHEMMDFDYDDPGRDAKASPSHDIKVLAPLCPVYLIGFD